MNVPPTPAEADPALRQIRHQQAESIRNSYDPGPWWGYLALASSFIGYGLGKDLNSVWGGIAQAASWMILVVAAVVQWRRRKVTMPATSSRRKNDAVTWTVILGFAAVTLAVLFGGPLLLAALGVQFPNTISSLAVGVMMLATIPLGRWSVRRAAARIESGM